MIRTIGICGPWSWNGAPPEMSALAASPGASIRGAEAEISKRTARTLVMRTISVVVVALLLVVGMPTVPTAQAVPTDVGYRDFSFSASGVSAPTGQKPQSKLWFADGSWWGALFSVSDSAFTVHRLDWGTQTWTNTGIVIDTRNSARVDTLWDGNALYTVSGTTGTTGVAKVMRFDYNSGTGTYSLASGFPVTVSPNGAESFVFDKDAAGNLWVTWTQDLAVYVTRSSGSETNWVSPFVLPLPGAADLTADDTSAVVAFGSSIGVMWSNQNDETMFFAIHADGAPDSEWILNPALSLPEYADDHINLKALQSTSDGRVFAVTKTSLNAASAPLILLLTMSPEGNWSRTTFGTVAENHTRPLLLLDESNDRIYVFAASPCCSGGTIYYKETSITNPNFAPGLGNIFIQSSLDPKINNISSTKQPLTAASGLLAIAGDDSTKFYLHNVFSLGGSGDIDPPETTISSRPDLNTGDTTAAFTFVADEPASTFECSIDGGPFEGCTSPRVYNGLATGSHHFEVRATDLASNTDPTPAAWDWTISPTTTFFPTADTYVYAGASTTNFGTATTLISDGGSSPKEAFVRFDVTGISSPVQGATLRVWVTNGTGNGPEVFPASNSWSESTVTWNTKPARTGSAIFDAGSMAQGAWYEFDVTDQVVGNGTFTFNLASVSTDGLKFDSREATIPPELIVQADSTPDSTPPTVTTFDPLSGAVDIPIGTTVTGVFSEPIDPSTINGSSFTLSNGGTVPSTVTYDAATMTATLTPDMPLLLATTYTATFTTAVQDLAGNPLAGTVAWTFATVAADTTPPETTITSGPTPTTQATSASFSFDASEPGSTFECSLDSASFTPCTSPASYSSLATGAHRFEVRATDLSGNTDLTPATWDWTIPMSLSFTPTADTYVSEKNPSANFGTNTTLESDGGNGRLEESLLKFDVSGLSNPVITATLRIYATNGTSNGPEVFPAESSWEENTVVWTSKPVRTGGAVVDAGKITKSAWFEFDVTSMITGNGTYTLNLASVSTDGLGFDSREGTNPPELVVEVDPAPDTTPPAVISTGPADGSTDVSISTSVTAVFSEPMSPATIDATSFSLSDGASNVAASVTYDEPTMTATLTPTGPLSFGTTYSATITVAAMDLNGNPLSASESFDFTTAATDTVPPETTIFTGPPVQSGSTSASFTFGSDETGSSFACELDGGGFSVCTSPASYTGLSLGGHHFEVRATDPSGNPDATPATWDWTITSDLTFLAVADTYVNDSRTTKNYGSSLVVISDGGPQVKEALLRFDVTGVGGTVQSAVLRIYATNGTGNGPEVFSADNGWDELTVTWATKPTRGGASIFDAGAIPAGGWYEFDVTSLVTGDGAVTFNLVSVSTDAVKFQSREVAGSEPQLIVTTG